MDILRKNIEELNMRLQKPIETKLQIQDETDSIFKFLLVSTHIHQVTGYSKVAYNLVKQIASVPNIKLIHFGFQKYSGQNEESIHRSYPANVEEIDAAAMEKKAEGGFCFSGLPEIIKSRKPNVIMIYNDFSVISQFLESIKRSEIDRNFKIWIYADQIYTLQQKPFIDIINRDADRIFTFSEYWRQILKKQGIHRPINILHHGFEETDFPIFDKVEMRKKLGLPENAFIFTSLNRNQPRKRLDLLIMAFAELVVKHPQLPIFLLMVCDKGEKGGWNLFEIYAREIKMLGGLIDGLSNRLLVTSKDMSYSDSDILSLYAVGDVGVSCAEGEGWGLCSFEMMGVGKPQVVSDVGGHKEFCNENNSIVVPVRSRYYLPNCYCNLGGEAAAVNHSEFAQAMEKYVLDSELVKNHGEAARAKVLTYSWKKVTESLKKYIKREIEDINEDD
jgi:glycosyltransferase involved in cell wall biosynthesis